MWTGGPSFEELMEDARQGCPAASAAIVTICQSRLLSAARIVLANKLRGLFDPSDFVQAVWQDFFSRHLHARAFGSVSELLRFLVFVTRGKVLDANRRHLDSGAHDRRRERSLQALSARERIGLAAAQPAPDATVLAADELEHALSHAPALTRRILVMAGAGYSSKEIACAIGLSESSIRRNLHKSSGRKRNRHPVGWQTRPGQS
jgi:DNA-directed RNA polymerase specialized sigma24 family protein